MRTLRSSRKVHDVAFSELVLTLWRAQRRPAAQHEQQLVDAVVEVVQRLRLTRRQLVQAHPQLVASRNEPLDVEAPALDRRVGVVPLVREDVRYSWTS